MKQWLVALTAILLAAARPAGADSIVFRTGERLTGTIVAEQPGLVIFDSRALGRIEVARERILELERDAPPAPAASPAAEARVAGTNSANPKVFLRIYADHGIQYELVQPVRVVEPLKSRTNWVSETLWLRGRLGFRGKFDAADFLSGHGQQPVDGGAEVRTLRFYTEGEFGLRRTNQFKLDLGVANRDFYLHDAFLRWPHLRYLGNLTLGYFTVPQTLENIESFGASTFMESASPGLAFSPGHRTGIQLDRAFFNGRMTAALGLFTVSQSAGLDFGDSSDSLARPTVRLTGLVMDQPDQDRRLHIGGSAAFALADSSNIRYLARPESHLAPVLVDTGLLTSRFAYIGGLEAIYQQGPLTIQSELMGSTVDADENYIFWGGYVSAGWLLTGERPGYDRARGVPVRVRPLSPLSFKYGGWGAVELAVRCSYLDLQDGNVNGGRMTVVMPGVNWYWNDNIRWQFNYGFAHVVAGPSPGNLSIFQMRLQLDL